MRQRHFFSLLAGGFALALAFLTFLAVERSTVKPRQELMISNVSVSVDFDDHQFLAGTAFRFPQGAKQVCVRFDYSRLEEDATLDVLWDWEGKRVQAGSYALTAPSGTRMYSLLKEDGSPLPLGSYAVTLRCGEDMAPQFHFEIY